MKKNAKKLRLIDLKKRLSHLHIQGKEVKELSIGLGSGLLTTSGNYDLKPGQLFFHQGEGTIYVYAECRKADKTARLVRSSEPLFDTDDEYLVFLQEGSFENIQFNDYSKAIA